MKENVYCVKCGKYMGNTDDPKFSWSMRRFLGNGDYDLCDKCSSKLKPKIKKAISSAIDVSPEVLKELSGGKYSYNPARHHEDREKRVLIGESMILEKLCGKSQDRRYVCEWCGDECPKSKGYSRFCSESCKRRYNKDEAKKQEKTDKKARKNLL